ncbi:very short patch repair endonuclease [Novosphingobium sp.]|uniref:very short patch repair endonuclease n=1 Tax=Novosphingobium sp. TaxID=1874826 RepID=UPI001E0926FE|nr:very short patch repair endonuclease [Novosphingobium sp.]MBX9665027.1 very short patch repair endonuclease [Novosphingobium sp.]
MADIVDAETRSRLMAGIRSKNTKPELLLRRALHARGLRYRLHGAKLPGKPDLVFAKHQAVIFVHGCFWHRHSNCRFATTPSTRSEFWTAKFSANIERDKKNVAALLENGWRIATVWECALKGGDVSRVAELVAHWLTQERTCMLEVPTA